MKASCKHCHKLFRTTVYKHKSTIKTRKFEIIFDSFNVDRFCTYVSNKLFYKIWLHYLF
jgi:hypothetical protein